MSSPVTGSSTPHPLMPEELGLVLINASADRDDYHPAGSEFVVRCSGCRCSTGLTTAVTVGSRPQVMIESSFTLTRRQTDTRFWFHGAGGSALTKRWSEQLVARRGALMQRHWEGLFLRPTTAFSPGGYGALNGREFLRSEWPWLWYFSRRSVLECCARKLDRAGGWSSGDGIKTFRAPEVRGEFIRVLDEQRGVDTALVSGTRQTGTNITAITEQTQRFRGLATLRQHGGPNNLFWPVLLLFPPRLPRI